MWIKTKGLAFKLPEIPNPQADYSAALARYQGRDRDDMVLPILERFPFQPDFQLENPAIKRPLSENPHQFDLPHLLPIDDEYYRRIRDHSLAREISIRKGRRVQIEEEMQKAHDARWILNERLRAAEFFKVAMGRRIIGSWLHKFHRLKEMDRIQGEREHRRDESLKFEENQYRRWEDYWGNRRADSIRYFRMRIMSLEEAEVFNALKLGYRRDATGFFSQGSRLTNLVSIEKFIDQGREKRATPLQRSGRNLEETIMQVALTKSQEGMKNLHDTQNLVAAHSLQISLRNHQRNEDYIASQLNKAILLNPSSKVAPVIDIVLRGMNPKKV